MSTARLELPYSRVSQAKFRDETSRLVGWLVVLGLTAL